MYAWTCDTDGCRFNVDEPAIVGPTDHPVVICSGCQQPLVRIDPPEVDE